MKTWLLLATAITAEVVATLSLRAAQDNPGWYALVATGYLSAFAALSVALRTGLGLGVAYGIWAASGVALTAVMAAVLFGDPLTVLMGAGIVTIIGGVLCVELGAHPPKKATTATEGGPK
ncbi:DMT family transporter [Nocardia alba]|uniref:Small multidrug resistance pump n=1 Tax=Nocardia alba TaxID=225051 RepID=A0A4R1F9A4_9NOCA|nr:SMR family transporter [Nocardia alba]TCJ89392.1 small multidrug resistance pump [Nocardia alba]